MSQKYKEDTCASWVNFISSSAISFFAQDGNLDGAFLDFGPSSDWVYVKYLKIGVNI